jgi:hypothetical protein
MSFLVPRGSDVALTLREVRHLVSRALSRLPRGVREPK